MSGPELCIFCDEPIIDGEVVGHGRIWTVDKCNGQPVERHCHHECGLREVLGGIGHITNHEHWCMKEHDPDAGMSYRESARMVLAWVNENGIEAWRP